MKKLLLTFACGAFMFTASAQNVTSTLIGTLGQGYSGDNGPASQAQLAWPSDVCLDANMNIYIADQGNNVIRKINAQTGIITTIAGNGIDGYSGDGGQATAAQLSVPGYICLDPTEHYLYISDGTTYASGYGSNTIRRVNLQTGIITTVAGNGTQGDAGEGGLATAAQINLPMEIACDPAGNIYFADMGNSKIKKINIQTGIITTIVGGGGTTWVDGIQGTNIMMASTYALAINSSGSTLYFSEMGGTMIRKVDLATGTVGTVAGGGWYFGEGQPAITSRIGNIYGMIVDDNGDIYIDDESCSCRRIDSTDGNIYKVAGDTILEGFNGWDGLASTIWFNRPIGLAINPLTGDAIVADMFNSCIRMVTQPDYEVPEQEEPASVTTTTTEAVVLYPNPSAGKFIIENKTASKEMTVQVYNAVGSLIHTSTTYNTRNVIDLTAQPVGMYQLILTHDGKKDMHKLVIAR